MFTRRQKIIFIITVLSISYFYLTRKPRKKASELLQDVLDYTELLKSTQSQIEEFLVENKFDQLVSEHVKLAVDKIASVRKQTEIMEGMERISGGPQNFMSTSLQILDKIQNDLYSWERQYRLATARIHRNWPDLFAKEHSTTQRISYFNSDDFFQPLEAFQLYFQPMDFVDEERQNRKILVVKYPKALEEIMNIVKNEVIPIIKEYERIKIEEKEPPEFKMSDLSNPKYLGLLQKLMSKIEKYGAYFETVSTTWLKIIKDTRKITDDALEIAKNSKIRYEELAVGLDETIANLKERIQNLKHAKSKSEL